MGAAGLGLFDSDHDFDCIADMYGPAGLAALEEKAKERAKSRPEPDGGGHSTGKSEYDDLPQLSLHAGQCADVELVRDHLNSGVLQKLIDEKKATIDELSKGTKPMDKYSHSLEVYNLVLIGVCAMTLGCKIPSDFKQLMIAKYRTTDFQRDALGQIQVALGDGPDRYKEGTPYNFPGLKELPGDRDRDDRLFPGGWLINTPAPFGLIRNNRPVPKRVYPADVCGACGADKRFEGESLLCCGGCGTMKYCGKVCQQAHYKQHKPTCKQQ